MLDKSSDLMHNVNLDESHYSFFFVCVCVVICQWTKSFACKSDFLNYKITAFSSDSLLIPLILSQGMQ